MKKVLDYPRPAACRGLPARLADCVFSDFVATRRPGRSQLMPAAGAAPRCCGIDDRG